MEKQVEDVANVHPILVENLPACRRVLWILLVRSCTVCFGADF
jgi:hypothetical protein